MLPNITGPKKDDICYPRKIAGTRSKNWLANAMAPSAVPTPTACAKWREKLGVPAFLVDTEDDIRAEWLSGKTNVGILPAPPLQRF
jgi:4-hydroxy-3-methylbut-2-enyl diphosphate reductase